MESEQHWLWQTVRRARRRLLAALWLRRIFRALAMGAAAAGLLILALVILRQLVPSLPLPHWYAFWGLPVVLVFCTLPVTRKVTIAQAALFLDRRTGMDERLSTALEIDREPQGWRRHLQFLAGHEAVERLRSAPPRALRPPLVAPRLLATAMLAIAALGLSTLILQSVRLADSGNPRVLRLATLSVSPRHHSAATPRRRPLARPGTAPDTAPGQVTPVGANARKYHDELLRLARLLRRLPTRPRAVLARRERPVAALLKSLTVATATPGQGNARTEPGSAPQRGRRMTAPQHGAPESATISRAAPALVESAPPGSGRAAAVTLGTGVRSATRGDFSPRLHSLLVKLQREISQGDVSRRTRRAIADLLNGAAPTVVRAAAAGVGEMPSQVAKNGPRLPRTQGTAGPNSQVAADSMGADGLFGAEAGVVTGPAVAVLHSPPRSDGHTGRASSRWSPRAVPRHNRVRGAIPAGYRRLVERYFSGGPN